MKTENLMGIEALASLADIRVSVSAEDLTAAGNTQTIPLLNVSSGDAVQLIGMDLVEAFANSADAAVVSTSAKIGDGVDDDRFLVGTELNANGAKIAASAGTGVRFAYTAEDTVDLVITNTTGKALLNVNKGKLVLLFKKISLPAFRG